MRYSSVQYNRSMKIKPKILLISTMSGIPRVHRAAKAYSLKSSVFILEWDRRCVLPKHETVPYGIIHRFRFRAPYGSSLLIKLPFWMIYLAIFFLTHRFDVIVPENLDTLMPTWILAKLCRIKIIYDVADFYADAYIPERLRRLRRLVATIEIFLMKRVDAVTVPNESVKHQIGRVHETKVSVIYNTPEDKYENLSHISGYDNDVDQFIDDNFTIFYGGGIFSDRGLHEIVKAIDGINGARLLIAGFGAAENEFKEFIKDRSNVRFLGKLEHTKILELTHLSNCIVILYDPANPGFIHASPNKMFEAMMCGKPIIAIKGTYMAKVVKQENCGLLIDSKDAEKLRITIVTLKENPALATELGNNGRVAFNTKYNWSIMERTLLTLLETIFHS